MSNNIYGATALTGGATGALDAIDGAALADLDIALVVTATAVYHYSLDADSGAAESSPDVISPDANAGTKRWVLISIINMVESTGNLTDNALVRGDGGAKGTQTSTVLVDDSGRMTNPSQPVFICTNAGLQSDIAINDYILVVFDSEIKDVGNNFASSIFTAPVTGNYQLSSVVKIQQVDVDVTTYTFRLLTSNRAYFFQISPKFASDPLNFYFSISITADMDANDTAAIHIYQTGGAQQTDIDTNTYFTGILVA